jgi:flagellar basal body rod protein FlgC
MSKEALELVDKIDWIAMSAQEPSGSTVTGLVLMKAPSINIEEALEFATGTVMQGVSVGVEGAEVVTYKGVTIYLTGGPLEALANHKGIYVMGNVDSVEKVLDVMEGAQASFYSENSEFVNKIDEKSMTMILSDVSASGGTQGAGSVLSGMDMSAIGADKLYMTIDESDLMMTMGINFIDETKAKGFETLIGIAKAMGSTEDPTLSKLEIETQGNLVKMTMPLPTNISETPFSTGTFT